jgi:hypothetical protein
MPNRRYNLPHLAFFQGFEAAARAQDPTAMPQ